MRWRQDALPAEDAAFSCLNKRRNIDRLGFVTT